ncbi:hypothetical protein B0H13DRAFT_2107803 [Mycena leptocephala]|nr:hypothetical protein B0H13DRAFT_2107803 [Mycena leptocephala]
MSQHTQYLASITIWVLCHFTTARRLNVNSPRCVLAFNASRNVIPERKSFQTTPSFHPRCSRLISKIRCFTTLV